MTPSTETLLSLMHATDDAHAALGACLELREANRFGGKDERRVLQVALRILAKDADDLHRQVAAAAEDVLGGEPDTREVDTAIVQRRMDGEQAS